jgi:D-alanyl-D-alanine carboxypeptidase
MFRAIAASSRGRRLFVLGLITAVSATVFTTDFAEAKRKRGKRAHHARVVYSPPFSTIIVDANSGAVLQANNPDAQRFPASLTKVMTLYLLFERLESGKMKLDTAMPVSENASEQAPTKLGLRAGDELKVEDAIKGLITRSANDASVVIAEAISGSEEEFGRLMTRKARALGMSRTVYRNPNGLPNPEQVTTARDQALLGRAIQDRFPRYYKYFATNNFYYRGKAIRNHNKLLGRVEGVDGIKTGFTRASGFNLVTSIKRGNRHLVGVVLGGRSGGSRDAIMRNLLAEHLERGATKRTVAAITEDGAARVAVAEATEAPVTASAKPEIKPVESKTVELRPTASDYDSEGNPARRDFTPVQVGAATPQPVAVPAAPAQAQAQANAAATPQQRMAPLTNGVVSAQALAPIPGSTEPMTPVRVKTLQVKAGPMKVASAGPTQIVPQAAQAQPVVTSAVEPLKSNAVGKSDLAPLAPNHGRGQGVLGTLPANTTLASAEPAPRAVPAPAPVPAPVAAVLPPQATPAAKQAEAPKHVEAPKPAIRPGSWIIQVGALESEAEAKSRLNEARDHARGILGKAEPFTETVAKGDKQLYRARFAGFVDKDKAEAVCKTLKRSDLPCFAMKY